MDEVSYNVDPWDSHDQDPIGPRPRQIRNPKLRQSSSTQNFPPPLPIYIPRKVDPNESLRILEQAQNLGIKIDSNLDLPRITFKTILFESFYSLPGHLMYRDEVPHLLDPHSLSASTIGKYLAYRALSIAAHAVPDLLMLAAVKKIAKEQLELISKIDGLDIDTYGPYFALHNHHADLLEGLRGGVFANSPDKERKALMILANGYLSELGHVYPTLDHPRGFLGGASSSGIDQDSVESPTYPYRNAILLMEKCEQLFGDRVLNGEPMNIEDERIFSMVRACVVAPLLNDRSSIESRTFIIEELAPRLEEISKGSGEDLLSALEMLNQIDKLTKPNIPTSRLAKIFDKISKRSWVEPKEIDSTVSIETINREGIQPKISEVDFGR